MIARIQILSFILLLNLLAVPEQVIAEPTTANITSNNKGVSEMFFSNTSKSIEKKKVTDVSSLVGKEESKTSFTKMFAEVFKGLLYCIATVLFGFSIYRRFFDGKASQNDDAISIIGKKAITPKSAVIIIETNGQQFLLSQTQEQLTLLAELKRSAEFDEDFIAAIHNTPLEDCQQLSANSK